MVFVSFQYWSARYAVLRKIVDLHGVLDLGQGIGRSGVAKEAAAQTLDKVKHAMQIDYFA